MSGVVAAPDTYSSWTAPPARSDVVSFHGVALPARAFSSTSRIPDSLVAAIDATRSTMLLALYEINLPGVTDAIKRAKARGVDVKLIYDQSHGTGQGVDPMEVFSGPSAQFRELLDANVDIRLLRGGGSYGIMHNKVAILDGELVETGSFNWSVSADQLNFENAIFRDDLSLAQFYASYWDWMWDLAQSIGAAALQLDVDPSPDFGTPPLDPAPSVSFKGGKWPRVAFSPAGEIEARLVDAISRCERTIDIAIFSLYSRPIADAIAAAHDRGVAVRIAGDVSQARHSPEVASLLSRGVELRLSAGRGGLGVLHHKFAILDGEMLATGSFNFSLNAQQYNFENQLYTTEPGDLAGYQSEFEAVWGQAHVPGPEETEGAALASLSGLKLLGP